MDDTGKDLIILLVLSEMRDGKTARQIARLTVRYQAPVSERDVNSRLQYLMTRSYVIQSLSDPQIWYITPEGIKWAAQNRRK